MTAAEREKCIGAIYERVCRIVGPFGVVVEHETTTTNKADVAEFTFKIPDADKPKQSTYQEVIVHLTQQDVLRCRADPAQLDCLARAWARICADWAPSLFDAAKVPAVDGVDWRPQETLPEDFYAA